MSIRAMGIVCGARRWYRVKAAAMDLVSLLSTVTDEMVHELVLS